MTLRAPPRKILVIKLRAMGDTVLLTAPLAVLRERYPRAEIHVVVLRAWSSLLSGHPAVSRVWEFDRHEDSFARAKAATRLAMSLRRERFDWVVNLHASPTSSMISFATGAPTRAIHFHGHNDANRYSTLEIPGKGEVKPIIERDMDTVRALGITVPAGRLPKLYLSSAETQRADQLLSRLKLTAPLLALGLGASRPTKRWDSINFARIATQWAHERQGGVLLITGPDESELIRDFDGALEEVFQKEIQSNEARASLRKKIVALPPQNVRDLAAVISRCALLVGNDSGPRHLAVSVDRPTVTLFGPEHPYEWHPYPLDRHPRFFIENLSCRRDAKPGKPEWCGLEVCIDERNQCMTRHSVHEVWRTMESLI